MIPIYIYALRDPRDQQIRYVGKTNLVNKRLSTHINKIDSRRTNKLTYKENWIQSLIKESMKPTIEVLETTDEDNWEERERFYIREFKSRGYRLTNSTDGGDTCSKASQKKVAKIDHLTNEVLEIYNSIQDAAIIHGQKSRSRISACCSGITQTSGGYKWRAIDTEGDVVEPKIKKKFNIRKVGQFDIEMNLVKVYPTLLSTPDFAAVHSVCRGKTKQCRGHFWRYLTDDNESIQPKIAYKHKTVAKYTLDSKYIQSYMNAETAAKENGLISGDSVIYACIGKRLTAAGYKWKYNDY